MTRMEKYQKLRNEIAQENKENKVIWIAEQKLAKYQQQLMKINSEYFLPVIKKNNDSTYLINLEKNMIFNNHLFLKQNDRLNLLTILQQINDVLTQNQNTHEEDNTDQTLISYPLEYKNLVANMKQKVHTFEYDLESKIKEINLFVENCEAKYSNINTDTTNFNDTYQSIKEISNKLQDNYQQIKFKNKINFKFNFCLFLLIVVCLITLIAIGTLLII